MILTSLMRIYLTRSLKPFEFKNTYSHILNYKDEPDLGLYVHIPFCRSLCSFCPYCKVMYDEDLAQRYKTALLGEIELYIKSVTMFPINTATATKTVIPIITG
jgi:coproporphyrinogen III oxidase-like Fe-S oxidoreductase